MLVLVAPLCIAGIGFQVAFRAVEENLKITHINMLQRSADIIENQLIDVETIALQIANANSIVEMAAKTRGEDNYISPAMNALSDFALFLNYQDIELMQSKSAYIYFRNTNLVMFEKSYYKPDIFKTYLNEWEIDYDEWLENMTAPDFVAPAFRRMGDGFEYAFPFSRRMFGERQGVIVFRIDEDVIFEKLKFINNLESRDTYLVEILDDNGERIWSSNTMEEFPELELSELEKGYVEKDGLSIIATKSDKLNWHYMLALPIKESLAELRTLRTVVFLLMAVAILGGIILSLIQAVNKGKPVDEALAALTPEGEEPEQYSNLGAAVSAIVRRHEDVLRQVEKDKVSLQKNFFDEILKAGFSTEAQLKTEAVKVGLDIDNQTYQTAYIQMFAENDLATVDEQTMNEIRVLSQLMKNHLRELCSNNVWFHKKNYNSEIAIFSIDHMEEDVIDLICKTKDWMMKECQVEITSGIGGTCSNLLLTWRSMEEAKIALENCTRETPVVGYRAELINRGEYYFPAIAEERLVDSLCSGQWQETKDILALLETENCVNRTLRRGQFIKLNRRLIDILGRGLKSDEISEQSFWINEVVMQQEIPTQEYFRRVRQLCRKICNENVEKKQEQRGYLVEEIKNYIQEHFCESDMGLSRVGGEFRMSESYLSTLFKEQAGRNFADYLETLRIEKACQLLQDTSYTVNDVAEAVGYNSVQSFRRAFKRVKGVSPKELRVGEEI